jgi:hypothetical protein
VRPIFNNRGASGDRLGGDGGHAVAKIVSGCQQRLGKQAGHGQNPKSDAHAGSRALEAISQS